MQFLSTSHARLFESFIILRYFTGFLFLSLFRAIRKWVEEAILLLYFENESNDQRR